MTAPGAIVVTLAQGPILSRCRQTRRSAASSPEHKQRTPAGLRVRRLRAGDLDQADRILRLAFGTFMGVPEPERFDGDREVVRPRWRADPRAALAAELDGRLVGSSFANDWGSVGVPGAPDRAARLLGSRHRPWPAGATMELFASWQTAHLGLYTFAQSAKHLGLYESFGFWPRYLTALMSAPVIPPRGPVSYRRLLRRLLHDPADRWRRSAS